MPPIPRGSGFFMMTVVTFGAFASGMGACLFDLDQVRQCLQISDSWVDTFKAIGDHIIEWGMQIGRGAFR